MPPSHESTAKQAILKITGHVQGVFYRAHAREKAHQLGLVGYAKNMPDGSVEVLVQGPETAIKDFIKWCQTGAPSATVEAVEAQWAEIIDPYQNFRTL